MTSTSAISASACGSTSNSEKNKAPGRLNPLAGPAVPFGSDAIGFFLDRFTS
jgi:hypothetical protein